MKNFFYVIATIIGALLLATLLSSLTGCGGSSQALNMAKQNRQDIKYEERDRRIADDEIVSASNKNLTHIANLETEIKRLRTALCKAHPEDCPPSVLHH